MGRDLLEEDLELLLLHGATEGEGAQRDCGPAARGRAWFGGGRTKGKRISAAPSLDAPDMDPLRAVRALVIAFILSGAATDLLALALRPL